MGKHGVHGFRGHARILLALALVAVQVSAACASAQRPSSSPPPPAAPAALARARTIIDSVVDQPRFRNAQWSVLVVDDRGDTLYSRNAGKLALPASNQKLITAAVSLAALGSDFRFATSVASNGVVRDSVLEGDLVVFGSGDPSFSDRIRGDAMTPLREMADSVRALGITRVLGRLRRGTPLFTDTPIGFGWAWDDLTEGYGATVGDLMFNEAFAAARVTVDGIPDTIPRRGPTYANFLDAFNAALAERGVAVEFGHDWSGTAPDSGLTTLVTYQSAPLSDLLQHLGKQSQNQFGEVLLKTLGLVRTGVGRADSGASVVSQQLLQWGADSGGFVVRDGSGLSRHNFVTAETLVRVLDIMRSDAAFAIYYDALPIAGVDGTLERRMRGTAAEGNARAKTGSMDRVRTLSGYVTTADGRLLTFALLATGWTVPGRDVEAALDMIVAQLAALRLGT